MRATLTSKSQLTLPAEIRRALRLGPGDQLDFTLHEGGWLEVRPVPRPEAPTSVSDLAGMLKGRFPPMTIEQMDEAIARGACEDNLPPRRTER